LTTSVELACFLCVRFGRWIATAMDRRIAAAAPARSLSMDQVYVHKHETEHRALG
jgi:hypothetical protein